MTAWTIGLLGGFALIAPDGEEVNGLGRRDRALLIRLALSPGLKDTRDRLAALLWSSRGEEQARHSLAQSTATLRKALRDEAKQLLQSGQSDLALEESAFEVDALRFETLAKSDDPREMEAAAALYKGALVPDLDLRGEDFDEWLDGQRRRLGALAADLFCRLAALRAEEGAWDQVLAAAERALEQDSLREDAHRLVMRALATSNQRSLALQHYKRFAAELRAELEVDPDPLSQELAEEIKEGRFDPHAALLTAPASKPEWSGRAPRPRPRRGRLAVGLWLSGGIFLLLLSAAVATVATFWRVPELAPAPLGAYVREIKTQLQPHPLSIAVLTFESHGEPDAADFAEALTSGVTSALSISSEMRVIARNEARRMEDAAPQTPLDFAQQAEVRYFLEGSVNKWGRRIVVEAGLVDSREGRHRIWSESYTREVEDFLSFQQEVTFDIIRSLEIRLTEGEQERISRMTGTDELSAWLAAARGEKLLRSLTPKDVMIARASYERALAIDPDYAGALEGLAWTYFIEARFGWTAERASALARAREIADRALVLEPARPQTHSLLGSLRLLEGDFAGAIELGEKAFALDPNDSDVAALLAYTLTYTGEPERALSLIDRAIELKPVPSRWYTWLRGRALRVDGRPEEAIRVLAPVVAERPNSAIPLIELAAAYSQAGEQAMAEWAAEEIKRLAPGFTVGQWMALSPYRNEETMNREAQALRATGLPD